MGYPLVLANAGDEFARFNCCGKWAVRWDKALNARYTPVVPRNKAMIACARVLMAAKDNFVPLSWDDSNAAIDQWPSNRMTRIIDYSDIEPPDDQDLLQVTDQLDVFAVVNNDATFSWSVRWEKVDELRRAPLDNPGRLPLIGIAILLHAAKDNFTVTRWPDA